MVASSGSGDARSLRVVVSQIGPMEVLLICVVVPRSLGPLIGLGSDLFIAILVVVHLSVTLRRNSKRKCPS